MKVNIMKEFFTLIKSWTFKKKIIKVLKKFLCSRRYSLQKILDIIQLDSI
jgi:hypothetical protein